MSPVLNVVSSMSPVLNVPKSFRPNFVRLETGNVAIGGVEVAALNTDPAGQGKNKLAHTRTHAFHTLGSFILFQIILRL